jgi:hypothetical protein
MKSKKNAKRSTNIKIRNMKTPKIPLKNKKIRLKNKVKRCIYRIVRFVTKHRTNILTILKIIFKNWDFLSHLITKL